MRTLHCQPLTAAAFAAYGDLLTPPAEPAAQIDYAGQLRNLRAHARPNLAVSRTAPVTLPYEVSVLERHEHSSQAFIPFDRARMLLIVCRPRSDGTPDFGTLAAFVGDGTAGINYHLGTWHHPMRVIEQAGAFVMLRWDDRSQADTTWYRLEQPLSIFEP